MEEKDNTIGAPAAVAPLVFTLMTLPPQRQLLPNDTCSPISRVLCIVEGENVGVGMREEESKFRF